MSVQPPVLTIAGSDPSGGAGIQADLKTFAAHGCYGMSVLTALTAQNTTGVQGVFPVSSDFVQEQMTSVLNDISPLAIKTGMLYDSNNVWAVVRSLRVHFAGTRIPPLVCDPVCVSTSGHALLNPDAMKVLISELLPLTTLVTPNKSEAELLLSHLTKRELAELPLDINSLESMVVATEGLLSLGGPQAVLLKGGHVVVSLADLGEFSSSHLDVRVIRDGLFGENMEILRLGKSSSNPDENLVVVDVLREREGPVTIFVRPHISTTSTHGTGCTLGAAITSELAKEVSLVEAVRTATVYTHRGIENAPGIGNGHGPLNHLHALNRVAIPAKSPSNPYPLTRLLIESSSTVWKEFVEHRFVTMLGQGVLPQKCFAYFIKQDYVYLRYYARAYGLLAAKSTTFSEIASATRVIQSILEEIGTHRAFAAEFGISIEDLENTDEGLATAAYGGYLLSTGLEGDATKLLMAQLSCLLGYGEVGLWLKRKAAEPGSLVKLDGNLYRRWIEDYSGVMYQKAVRVGLETIETRAEADPPSPARLQEWVTVWKRCTEFERGFWDAAMQHGE
ncbi:hypothetical protein L218DRAFT_978926 [Marasmius fiardii PR-910]|nr:hypothetical protein L218DRAFT_978926 [Marasmius fiardii PR-910]